MSGVFDFDWQRTYCFLLFLLSEEETAVFDSRLIYERVANESKRTYAEWIDFAAASWREFEQSGFGLLDMRFSPTGEEFLLLRRDQALYFLVYSQTTMVVTFAELDFYLFRFRKNHHYPEQDLSAMSWGRFLLMDFLWLRNRIQEQGIERKEALSTKKRTSRGSEKKLELAFGKHLEEKGIVLQHQIRCEYGIADIVTSDTIYEIKAFLTKAAIHEAIGQLLVYRACINPSARLVVVGRQYGSYPVHTKLAESAGVGVIIWESD